VPGRARHFQKFVGLELIVRPETMPPGPTLMDASVPQHDGFRFLYVLPLGRDRVLVEDTYYSDDASLDVDVLHRRVLAYADRIGLDVLSVTRREQGVLPLPVHESRRRHGSATPCGDEALCAGYAGGFFHPTTGYSFPFALRVAVRLAEHNATDVDDSTLRPMLDQLERQQRFARWLNRLLFSAFAPDQRSAVLERFYQLPVDTIRRFYSLQMTPLDRARIVCGRPPRGFSVRRLLAAPVPPIAQGNTP
jgi:lycopene beta-cyclase